jgi:hypothetical protein
MKQPILSRRALVAAFAVFACAIAAAAPAAAQTARFEPKVQGYPLGENVDQQKLVTAITKALMHYNWRVVESKPGFAKAVFEKEGGKISATIGVSYDGSGYSIEYLDSKNLDVNLKKKVIHRNYVRWINNLNKAIGKFYTES